MQSYLTRVLVLFFICLISKTAYAVTPLSVSCAKTSILGEWHKQLIHRYVQEADLLFGFYGGEPNYERARQLYAYVEQQQFCLEVRPYVSVRLAYMCELGLGGPQDIARALNLYYQAIHQSENKYSQNEACFRLGEMLFWGIGVVQNYHQACICYERVMEATIGSAMSMYALDRIAQMLHSGGYGVVQDFALSRALFERLLNMACGVDVYLFTQACLHLGLMYALGHGGPQDYQAGRLFLQEVITYSIAHRSYPDERACIVLADMCFQGLGGVRDYDFAATLFKKVLEQQTAQRYHAPAYLRLGQIFFAGGYGIERDLGYAKDMLEHAVQTENLKGADRVEAQRCLAVISGL